MMLRDDVVDQGYYGIEPQEHYQSFPDKDAPLRDETSHDSSVYTSEVHDMKIVMVGSIPHWEDANVRLPIIAGGDHIPGHIGTSDSTTSNVFTGDLFNLDGTFVGTLVQRPSGKLFISTQTATGTTNLTEFKGGSFLTAFNEGITLSEGGQITSSRDLPFPSASGSAPSFASTQAAQTQQEQFLQAQAQRDAAIAARAATEANRRAEEAARAREAFDEEQAEIDRELRLRESRLATARDLVGIRSAEAREARTQGTQISGEDPFRFLAIARGLQGPTGTTPSAGFKQNLLGAAQFQAPDLTGLDSNALQSAIQKLSQSNVPQGSPTFGFAHGGTTRIPTSGSVSIDVGEPIDGRPNPETVILRPDGSVEVVQKVGSAQTGGAFSIFGNDTQSAPTLVTTPDRPETFFVQQTPSGPLRHLISASALPSFDLSTVRSVPSLNPFGPLAGSALTSANVGDIAFPRPQFDLGGFGPLFDRLRGSLGGSSRSDFGFLPTGTEQETSAPFQAFAGPILNIQQGLGEALAFQGVPGAASEAQRLSALIGQLPAPFKIPPTFFQSLLPAEQTALISAYRLSGVPEQDFRHLLTAPQLSFNPQRATAVG